MLATTTETKPGLHLELSEDQIMLQNLARDFARKEIIPQAEHYDRTGEWPWDVWKKALKVGLVNLNIPEEYGGVGASVLEECIVGEELAYGCSGIQTALMLNQLATLPDPHRRQRSAEAALLPKLTEAARSWPTA
jgi:acyl-CoA dehydrogenase